MGAIAKNSGQNLPLIKQIQLFDLNGISMPTATNGLVSEDITGATLDTIYIMENSGTARYPAGSSNHGQSYSAQVQAFIPATRLEALQALIGHKAKHSAAVITDENDQVRIIGSTDEYITLKWVEGNQQNKNGYDLTISIVSSKPIPYFTGAFT